MMATSAGDESPSAWIVRWSHLIPERSTVLDVACGRGRHVRWFAGRACRVTAIDRNAAALDALRADAEVVLADIESAPWPLAAGRTFDAVVVTHYLWRPLLPTLVAALSPGGVLLYETFALGQQTIGKPTNPDFLLRPNELLHAAHGLHVVAFEDGYTSEPPRFVQRIAAIRGTDSATPATVLPARHRLPAD